MQNATIDRLSKIISDPRPDGGDLGQNKKFRRPAFRLHIGLEEGWFSLFLLATVVYSTIWCVQAVNWVDNLNILSLTTALGLLAGVIASKQRRLPRVPTHLLALALGLLIAFWQTAGADYDGNTVASANAMHQWVLTALAGGTSDDGSIFLFLITALGFILAYTSAWLVYRTRSPWLMIVANAVVLLINLSNVQAGYIVFLIVFLIASLLLLLRFNLFESVRRWRKHGLRYADDLGWDVMQAGALISIGILILSWVLPWGYTNDAAATVWSADSNPWVQLQNTWNRLISVNGGTNAVNHGNFRDTLVLGGNPNLNNDIVFIVQSDDGKQYLASVNYDTYDGRKWTNGLTFDQLLKVNQTIQSESSVVHTISQTVKVVNPPGEQYSYLFGASQIGQTNLPVSVLFSKSTGSVVAWVAQNGRLTAGQTYTLSSYVSSADEKTLRGVPMPADAPRFPDAYDGPLPISYYEPTVLDTYLQLPKNLDPRILTLARQITAGAPTMYDKAIALENYLRSNYTYDVNINLPPGQEGVSWFLFRSGNRGFCNYFSSSMTVMARLLGMPSRVVVGYTHGTRDSNHNQWIVRGTDAHSWTQIYFAGYGWVNFEPSASFSGFDRPAPGQFSQSGLTTSNPIGPTDPSRRLNPGSRLDLQDSSAANQSGDQGQSRFQLGQQVGLALGSFILLVLFALIFFGIWWRRLFRGYRLPLQLYGRMTILASWAGISLQRSQTPFEYVHSVSSLAPGEEATFERLGDIYVRELWADPQSMEHPSRSGEVNELPGLWKRLQPRLFLYVLRHPYFLRWLPSRLWKAMRGLVARRRAARRLARED
jgi:hypothetical protein